MTHKIKNETYYERNFYPVLTVFIVAFIIFITIFIIREVTKPLYIVVAINPNHGGKEAKASQFDGDRYDELTSKFTKDYKEGLYYQNLSEFDLLLNLSKKIYNLFKDTKTKTGWKKFEKILKKYAQSTNIKFKKVVFEPLLTKETNYNYYEKKEEKDINRYFRLMDSPSKSLLKKYHKGILSFIYKYRADIILNFDLNYGGSDSKSIFSINVPSFYFFEFVKNKIIKSNFSFNLSEIKNNEYRYIIQHWWGNNQTEKIRNLINDVWIYFTGYIPKENYIQPDLDKFMGLGYNMFDWDYRDSTRWYKDYDDKDENPHYNSDLRLWKPAGEFWKRERMIVELKRRKDGILSFGGDNLYASEEIIKYIQYILATENFYIYSAPPVFKYDELSLYTTGISININLGSIYKEETQKLLTKYSNILSEAICVGIYSISAGFNIKTNIKKDLSTPVGKPIDFKFYQKEKYCGKKSRR